MPRVAIVEDHRLLADMLQVALQQHGIETQVVVPCEPDAVLDEVCAIRPELVLLDLDLGTAGDGADLVPALVGAGCTVLLVTGVVDRVRIARALEAGAVGFQSKADGFPALVASARAALTTPGPLDPAGRAELLAELARDRTETTHRFAPYEQLTDRERDVLRAMADGRSVRDMAQTWVLSDATVRTHVRGVLTKLGERSQLGAVVAATRNGWLRRDVRTRG